MYEVLLVAGAILWGGMLLFYLRHPAASGFHPVTFYLLFHGILFTIRPILAWTQGFNGIYLAYRFAPTMAEKMTALLVADLALIVFVAVALRVGGVPFSRAPGTARRAAVPRFTTALLVTLAVCLPLPLAALASSFAGGPSMEFDATTGIAVSAGSSGYFRDSVLMLGPLAVIFAWAGRFRLWAFAPLLLFILVKAGTGGRWPFVMAGMSGALFWMYEHRQRWFPPGVLLAATALLALFTVIGADRGAALRQLVTGEQRTQVTADYFRERPLESMDYGNLEFVEFLVHVVPAKSGTYDYFLSNLQLLTEPIPRSLWPGKPIGPPIQRVRLWEHGSPIGLTGSVSGAGWVQAGWVGVVIWSALFAAMYGRGYALFVRSDQSIYKTAAFMILTPVALQAFRDGALLTVLKTSFFPLVPVLVWWGASRLFPDSDRAAIAQPAFR